MDKKDMTDKTVSTKPLEKALASLNEAITETQLILKNKQTNETIKKVMKAGVIQNFEFCYELSWKVLKRFLELNTSDKALINKMFYQQVIREGAQHGLIHHAERWLTYREKRNLTSHTYHAETAETVYQTAIQFYQDAFDLLQKLKEHTHD
jgi:nucleotidyltransferase substrate binding protein (TIGR01987 family)